MTVSKNGDLRPGGGGFSTKPTQGSAFKRMRDLIMNNNQTSVGNASQECVGARRWSGVARGNNPGNDATTSATGVAQRNIEQNSDQNRI